MSAWERFRDTLRHFEGEARIEMARRILAANQEALEEDPPDWLIAAGGMRALAERNERGVIQFEEGAAARPAPQDRKAELRRQLEEKRAERRRLEGVLAAEKRLLAESRRKRAEEIVDRAVRRGYVHRARREEVLRDFEHDPRRLTLEFEPEFAPTETDEQFGRRFEEQFGFAPEGVTVAQREPDEEALAIAREFNLDPAQVL